jgi:hypothetical protein
MPAYAVPMTGTPNPQPEPPKLIGESNATELPPEDSKRLIAGLLAGMVFAGAPGRR